MNLDLFLFAIFPYLAMAIFFIETIRRYYMQMYSYTSLSSQFLESKKHFWGIMSFHYGIIGTLSGHVLAFLIPREILWWNSYPVRLYVLELTALVFGSLALFGICSILYRRLNTTRVNAVTTSMDWVVYAFLILMISSGVYVAVFHGWGTSWFAASVTPYLWSLIKFTPQIDYVVHLPVAFKVHMLSAFLLIAVFPFTKLVHVLVIPNQYMFRKRQVVRWYKDRSVQEEH